MSKNELASLTLKQLERVVEENMLAFKVVGTTLMHIRDSRKFETGVNPDTGERFGTFTEYMTGRWYGTRQYGYYCIAGTVIRGYLEKSTAVDFLPSTEKQVRPLSKLASPKQVELGNEDPEDWARGWKKAIKIAGDREPTEKEVKKAVDELLKKRRADSLPDAEAWDGTWALDTIHRADVSSPEFLKTMPDERVDFLVTDPPWAPDEDNGYRLYGAAAKIALKCLKPGGRAAIYLGKLDMPFLLGLLGEYLDYEWMFAAYQPGGAQMFRKTQYFESWRPIGIFSKPGKRPQTAYCPDAIVGTRDKSSHRWQQNLEPPLMLVQKYTSPGQVVMEPFTGGATSLVACEKAEGGRRRWIAFDNDPEAIASATRRLKEVRGE